MSNSKFSKETKEKKKKQKNLTYQGRQTGSPQQHYLEDNEPWFQNSVKNYNIESNIWICQQTIPMNKGKNQHRLRQVSGSSLGMGALNVMYVVGTVTNEEESREWWAHCC